MLNDRELLELAAKAAGEVCGEWIGNADYFDGVLSRWNPLIDDGDALRLAVKLKITPHIDGNMTDCEDCTEAHSGTPYAATRRAIVRAAAEIGRQNIGGSDAE